jgi:diacylglycerol kinase (ATP)
MEKTKPNGNGLSRIFRAAHCSKLGLQAAFIHEQAFRQELFLCLMLAPLGLWLGEGGVERSLLLGSLLLVLIVELLNSAIEAVVDRIGVEHHELSGRAKDLGSAAVTLSLVQVVVVWLLLLY